MKQKLIVSFAALLLQQAISFSQTNPLVKYLPDNASMVMSFNPTRLADKVPGETFRQSMMYREMMQKDNDWLKTFFSDPSASGIDFLNDLLLVTVKDTSDKYSGSPVNILGVIKNEGLFELAIKKLSKGKDSLHIYGTDKIFFSENVGATLGWNSRIFVISTGAGRQIREEMSGVFSDTAGVKDYDKSMKKLMDKIQRAQRDLCFYLLTPRPDNTLSGNTQFTGLMNSSGDIKVWNSGTSPNPVFSKIPQLALFSKLQSLTGKNKTSVINFENGKIAIQSRSYLEGAMAEIYKRYPRQVINTDLTRRLPKGKVLLLMNTSYNTEMGKELMDKSELGELIAEAKGKIPFDFSSIQGVFKNNMMLAVIKSDEVAASDSITDKMGGLQVFLAMPIADKTKFEALRSTAKHTLDSLKNAESGAKMLKGFNPFVKYNDDLFVLSLSAEAASAFINGPASGTVPEWLQAYDRHPMVMHLNLKELFAMLMGKNSKGIAGAAEKIVLDMFDQLVVYGGDFENESLNTTMEFKFTNQNDNALKQLFELINTIGEKNKNVIAEENRNTTTDTITIESIKQEKEDRVPPPPPPPKPGKNIKTPPKKKTKN